MIFVTSAFGELVPLIWKIVSVSALSRLMSALNKKPWNSRCLAVVESIMPASEVARFRFDSVPSEKEPENVAQASSSSAPCR